MVSVVSYAAPAVVPSGGGHGDVLSRFQMPVKSSNSPMAATFIVMTYVPFVLKGLSKLLARTQPRHENILNVGARRARRKQCARALERRARVRSARARAKTPGRPADAPVSAVINAAPAPPERPSRPSVATARNSSEPEATSRRNRASGQSRDMREPSAAARRRDSELRFSASTIAPSWLRCRFDDRGDPFHQLPSFSRGSFEHGDCRALERARHRADGGRVVGEHVKPS